MKPTPIDSEIVNKHITASGLKKVGHASIREMWKIVAGIEDETHQKYIRMEIGIPGLKTPEIAINAEIEALRNNCSAIYPNIEGIPELKKEISRFVKGFIGTALDERCCIPTVGSLNGSYIAMFTASRTDAKKDSILFIDPGFPVHKQQVKILGINHQSFDVYEHRGEKLEKKLREVMSSGRIAAILYSNPNNPSWICFNEMELKTIGKIATEFDAIVIEDLAYFAMDFRKDLSQFGKPPYQASVSHYTDNYILLISSSKSFSYAGQRIGMMAISNKLFDREYEHFLEFFPSKRFGHSLIYSVCYPISAGVTHSAQYGLAALLKAVNDGAYDFVAEVKHYGKIAKKIKPLFLENGFTIPYSKDVGEPIADGFYFTIGHPLYSGEDLVNELLYYGISAIPLSLAGCSKEGLRACVSLISEEQIPILRERLEIFNKNHCTA